MKVLNYISRILVGTVFIFSGTVKAIDPSGFVYKLQDYFRAFNISFLDDLSLPLTILLCTLEFLSGFSVLFNIRIKAGIWIVILMMMVFTPLTLVLALTNPVSDCGCFGDAILLTNWQTFWKNIILLVPSVWLLINRNKIISPYGITRGYVFLSIIAVLFIAFNFYNLRYLPVIDFLPYKTGTFIPDKMKIPEGKSPDVYKTTFIYEKSGERREFDISNYPAHDTNWKFIDQKSVLVSRGYQSPIHDFIITSMNDEDLTQQILSSDGYTVLMISRKIAEADPGFLRKGYELGYYCMGNSVDFYVLTASGSDEVRKINNGLNWCMVDETTLKTMIRSNPGYILLKHGTVLHKWSWANLPKKETILEITSNTN
jgi:hypothetical protein